MIEEVYFFALLLLILAMLFLLPRSTVGKERPQRSIMKKMKGHSRMVTNSSKFVQSWGFLTQGWRICRSLVQLVDVNRREGF